jgi:exopolysaccharide biosynthesis protein
MQNEELQKYMDDLGCIDAINLDGGGSTTMWTKEKGIVNNPSDKSGERPVANALLILKNVK